MSSVVTATSKVPPEFVYICTPVLRANNILSELMFMKFCYCSRYILLNKGKTYFNINSPLFTAFSSPLSLCHSLKKCMDNIQCSSYLSKTVCLGQEMVDARVHAIGCSGATFGVNEDLSLKHLAIFIFFSCSVRLISPAMCTTERKY